MMRARVFLLLLILFMNGCWDVHDIDRRAFVFVIGVDQEANGSFVVSGRVTRGAGGSESTVRNGPALEARGRSMGECMERMAGMSDRRLDWGNLRTIILGERLSRGGIAEPLRPLFGAPRVPADVVVLQARGRADAIVAWIPPGEEMLQRSLENVFAKGNEEGTAPVLTAAWKLQSWLDNPGQDPYLGVVTKLPHALVVREVAFFRDGRLAGWLGADQAKVFQWTRGRGGGYALLTDPDLPSRTASIRIRSARSRLKTVPGNPDRLVMSLSLSGETIEAAPGGGAGYFGRLRRKAQGHIRRQVLETAEYVQLQNAADIWGFGELARRKSVSTWSEAGWRKRWRKAVWDVHVDLQLSYQSRYKLDPF